MRILHILNLSIPIHCGYSFRTQAILENQRAQGWETVHLTSAKHGWEGMDKETVSGLEFYRTAPLNTFWSKLPVLNQIAIIRGLTKRLQEVVEIEKPDVLHAHSPALTGIAALRVGKAFGIPVVYENRAFWEDAAVDQGTSKEGGFRYRLTRALESYVFKRAQAVTTICEGLRGEIIGRGVPEQKVTVIPNAVDLNKFQPLSGKDERLVESLGLMHAKVLGFIGSFYSYEGLAVLLDALPLIANEHPEVKVLLVGGGEQDVALRQKVKRLGLESRVIFTGRVPHDEVSRYYSLVDLFVYPRLSMRLTDLVTPLKPLEAMAQARLVLASDVGGHKELIEDGKTGWLFKHGDPRHLALRIKQALETRYEWDSIRQNARAFVEAERTWQVGMKRYSRVYQSVLKTPPPDDLPAAQPTG